MKTSTLGIIVALIIGGAIVLSPEKSNTKAAAPPANSAYVPGGGGCGTSNCHNAQVNIGPGKIEATFSGANNEYVPGQTYTITVSVTDNTKQRFGFQAAATDPNNQQAGTFIVTNTTNTSTQSGGGLSFIGHKSANSNSTWSFDWTAPATDVGPIKIYLAGNAANNNNSDSGDNIYTNVLSLNAAQGVGIASATTGGELKIVSQDYANITVETGTTNETRNITLLTISGQVVYMSQVTAGASIAQIPCGNLAPGIYLIHCGEQTIKFVKP